MKFHIYMKIPNNYERCVIKCTSLNSAPLSGEKFVKKNTKKNKKKNVSANAALSGGKLLLRSHFRRRCPPSTTRPFHERRRKIFIIFKICLSSAFYFQHFLFASCIYFYWTRVRSLVMLVSDSLTHWLTDCRLVNLSLITDWLNILPKWRLWRCTWDEPILSLYGKFFTWAISFKTETDGKFFTWAI